MSNYVPGSGAVNAKLMIVAEAPGKDEDAAKEPLVGRTGQLVNEMLKRGGLSRDQVYCTNVVKYRPPNNDIKLLPIIGHSIEEGIPQLEAEIKAIKPNCILALGDLALKTLTSKRGIGKYRGSILSSHLGPKVVSTLHPAGLLYSDGTRLPYSARTYIQLDFNRAIEESKTRELNLPHRLLQIAKGEFDVYQFFETYKDKKVVSVDIETPKQIPFCISFAFNKSHAISIPLLNCFGIEIPKLQLVGMWRRVAEQLGREDLKVIGQNFKFDQEKLLAPLGMKVGNFWLDVMFLAHTLHPELLQRLSFITSIYTREPFYKDDGKEYNPKKDPVDRLLTYNARDAAVTFECYENMYPYLVEYGLEDHFFNQVMPLHSIYMDIEKVGFNVDLEQRRLLWIKYDLLEQEAMDKLFEIVGYEFKVRSNPVLRKIVFEELGFPVRDSLDEDHIVSLLANHAKTEKQEQFLQNLLDVRRYSKTKETYLEAPPDYDGRHRTSYRATGTETGRSSNTKLEPPLRPEYIHNNKIRNIGLPFQNITKHGEVGPDIRKMLVCDPGRCFIEADLSQAEPRIVALLSKDYELLEKFEKGIDIHRWTAALSFSLLESQVTKPIRFVGKQVRNGGNYDMQKHTLMITTNSGAKRFGIDIKISEWKAGKILDSFHQFTPNVRGVYHKEVIDALQNNSMILIAPSGARRQFLGRFDHETFKEAFAHIPQRTVRDQVINAMKALRANGIAKRAPIVVESHDALVLSARIEEKDEIGAALKVEFEKEIDFSNCTLKRGKLRIPAELQISYKSYYSKDFTPLLFGVDERLVNVA